ncbi:MAG TPA: hypothetical protein VLK28_08055 [Methylomirabilota bacterium]|nr:hypothetical protein [Methylomirabilota bacterium]
MRALTRVATPETEARLLAVGRAGTASHVERIVRGWRRVDRLAEGREARRQHEQRGLHVVQDDDGTVVLRGRLTPEETLYQRARHPEATPSVEAPMTSTAIDDPALAALPRAQQQADALVLLAETALHHALDPGPPGGALPKREVRRLDLRDRIRHDLLYELISPQKQRLGECQPERLRGLQVDH